MSDNCQFSEREKQVTELLLQGKSNKQIALALGISTSTVEYHLKNVYRKLQVNSRTEAVLRLGKSIGSNVTGELGESTVEMKGETIDNGLQTVSTRRISMNKTFAIIGSSLLTMTLVVLLYLVNQSTSRMGVAPTAQASLTPTHTLSTPFNTSPLHLYEVSNNPPREFFGEWVNKGSKKVNMTRVSIQMKAGETHINMFGLCQPTDCNFLEYSPTPTVDYNYDSKTGILNVLWIFDFEALTQELTLTSEGKLKVLTRNHYLDNSGRLNFETIEYFAMQ